eukprot:CAMPEP_0178957330 /NCGR_PEP_ID=MMETSP0789-20121207/10846_1 /TAXON_ID=3005 /ORGANISM="Rhizosolenia setigera, Strain CCMP 1694" /LENGTH=305 /DNA_ID=CAMNT_0020639551 /DNA_START=424 /DNA_END=1341 /DNA_ORIENTATION=-
MDNEYEKEYIKRRRLIMVSSNVSSPWPDIPATFDSLNNDTLGLVLEFVGNKSYRSIGGVNKHCKEIYLNTPGTTKETFLFGYGSLAVIIDRCRCNRFICRTTQDAVAKGVVFYNRRDVMDWALEEQNTRILEAICNVAGKEGRIDLLNKVFNNIDDEDGKDYIFECVDSHAAESGKLDVLKWFETKGFDIDKFNCAAKAAFHGHLHIIQWLKEERGLELKGELYLNVIEGSGQLHVMKWLREQSCPWSGWTFASAAKEGNLDILQWLHDEGCPWSDDYHVPESDLKPEVIDWCRVNGYANRVYRR